MERRDFDLTPIEETWDYQMRLQLGLEALRRSALESAKAVLASLAQPYGPHPELTRDEFDRMMGKD